MTDDKKCLFARFDNDNLRVAKIISRYCLSSLHESGNMSRDTPNQTRHEGAVMIRKLVSSRVDPLPQRITVRARER
jgi:hypothetical protein